MMWACSPSRLILLTGQMLGNFSQAYSHVGLINFALNMSREIAAA
jgi:GH15 family glucan-1,4-alpha-glucosidase